MIFLGFTLFFSEWFMVSKTRINEFSLNLKLLRMHLEFL
jgi:hypothetical protein